MSNDSEADGHVHIEKMDTFIQYQQVYGKLKVGETLTEQKMEESCNLHVRCAMKFKPNNEQ